MEFAPQEQAAAFAPLSDETLVKGALSAAFDKAASFIHGELTQASMDAVKGMYERHQQQIKAKVDAALPEGASETLRAAATEYCIALSRTRTDKTGKELKEKFAQGEAAIKQDIRSMMYKLDELEQDLQRELRRRRDNPKSSASVAPFIEKPVHPVVSFFRNMFGTKAVSPPTPENAEAPANENKPQEFSWNENQRIYFKLADSSSSPVLPYIEKYLTEQGYKISDYAGGYATDNRKNTLKIGKLLKDQPALLQAYQEDPYRLNSGGLTVVLTRSYEDLARASYARGWQSCRAESSTAVRYGVAEIDLGVIAAYLVREDDPDIHNPLGRINLKPYHRMDNDGPKSDTIYMTFNPIGLHHPGFVDAVNRFAEENLNGQKYGKFKLPDNCESYQELTQRTRIPQDAEGALKWLGVKFKKDRDGQITVDGDINMSKMGLSRLPDLRDVIVNGSIDVSGNKLLTLEGLPTAPIKSLNASQNLLTCFAGCTPDVGAKFDYRDNAYLITTFGAPKAESYVGGNGKRDRGNYQTTQTCVGPLEEPKRFPGFKRKD